MTTDVDSSDDVLKSQDPIHASAEIIDLTNEHNSDEVNEVSVSFFLCYSFCLLSCKLGDKSTFPWLIRHKFMGLISVLFKFIRTP